MAARSNTLTNALAAAAIGVLQLGVTISLATLIFSGQLAPGAGRAAAAFVLGTAIVSLLVGATSKLTVVTAGAQDTAAVLVAGVATAIVASPDLQPSEMVPTVIVMIAITGVATGLVFWILGQFGLTSFVRFLPFPVISGFTAGTGWLLFRGGIEVMHGRALSWGSVGDLTAWAELKFVLPGLALALSMLTIVNIDRIQNMLVSVAILGATALFHLIGRASASYDELEASGWFIGPFETSSTWAPIGPDDIRATDWSVLLDNFVVIAAVVAVSVIGLLLNLSGLENSHDPSIDMNHEMRSAGFANLLVGASGGLIGYHLLGDTLLGRQIGARGRTVPIVVAAMAAATFFIGPDLIAFLPRAVAGGVLAGLGVSMIGAWVRSALPHMNRTDQLLSFFILLVIAVLGVLPGVGAGVVAAAAVFVVKYSRTDPVRHIFAAAGRSRIDRHARDRAALSTTPESVVVFELQGYLFFGSITGIRRQIDEQVGDAATSFVVIDFSRVTGIDSTAAGGLIAVVTSLANSGVTTIFSGLSSHLATELRTDNELVGSIAEDLDHAIAWCEDRLLAVDQVRPPDATADVRPFSPDVMAALDLPEIRIEAGETLIKIGDDDQDMYFVTSGTLTAWLYLDGGEPVRIRQVLPGAALGEITFVSGDRRTATVIADTTAVVSVLRREHFEDVAKSDPEVAIAVQAELLRRMGDRLTSSSEMVRDLLQ